MPQSTTPPAMPAVLQDTPGISAADHAADEAEHKGRAADHDAARQQRHVHERKGDAHRQRVQARRDGHHQQLRVLELRVTYRLVPAAYRLHQHLHADKGQQEKADVRRVGAHEGAHRAAQQVADERHQELKTAEIQPQQGRVLRAEALDREAARHRDGECVH